MRDTPFGRPPIFCEEITLKLIDAIEQVLVMRHVAGLAGIHYATLKLWLAQGKDDIENNKFTELAHFFARIKGKQAQEVSKLVKKVNDQSRNWQAAAWLLERCYREDFGNDAGVIQDLLDRCSRMEQNFNKLLSQGANPHGQGESESEKLDQGCDQK